jgi:hypothetical protein
VVRNIAGRTIPEVRLELICVEVFHEGPQVPVDRERVERGRSQNDKTWLFSLQKTDIANFSHHVTMNQTSPHHLIAKQNSTFSQSAIAGASTQQQQECTAKHHDTNAMLTVA